MSCVKVSIKPAGLSFQSLYITADSLPSSSFSMNYRNSHNISSIVTSPSQGSTSCGSSSSLASLQSPHQYHHSHHHNLLHPSSSTHHIHNHTRPAHHPKTQPLSLASPTSLLSPHSSRINNRGASEIIPRIYISDLSFAENPNQLASHRITHILSVLPDTIFSPPESVLTPQPKRLQVKIEDFPFAELAGHLPETTKWIRDALKENGETRVLVHCAEGISRSVSVVAAFLMAQFGWTPGEAVGFIKSKRRIADPNFGFVQQLHEYGRDELGQVQVQAQQQLGTSGMMGVKLPGFAIAGQVEGQTLSLMGSLLQSTSTMTSPP
ncbi:phosphatases II [Pluteus cervinus]|uniref:Phosphatases II n=1 Tax=Pluteus cervinus TaxID=181527 RepID=A0ACD3AA64_9AGAR|nr:phosphatases II [Pluteus cervinus]